MPLGIAARVYLKDRADSRRRLQVTRHRALWCSDFPPPPRRCGARAILRPSKIMLNLAGRGADYKSIRNRVLVALISLSSLQRGSDFIMVHDVPGGQTVRFFLSPTFSVKHGAAPSAAVCRLVLFFW